MRLALLLVAILWAAPAAAEPVRGVVVDQTGLVVPGVDITAMRGGRTLARTVTAVDGTFEIDAAAGDTVVASLTGFDPVTVAPASASRIVLTLAHAADAVTVSAAPLSDVAGVSALGSTLTPEVARRLPLARQKAVESLPLLPSVVRGPDGLLRLNGARPHEAALLIDGFDLSDPVSGTSTIDLPLEAVQRVLVMRDPMSVSFGGSLGAVAAIETAPGGDTFAGGLQSFLPHPRVARTDFGRIDGFFPRVYVSGTWRHVRYRAAQEYDFERIPVPGVTRNGSPMMDTASATSFWRADFSAGARHHVTTEGLLAPDRARRVGMSPLRAPDASPTLTGGEVFVGVIDRVGVSAHDVLTLRGSSDAHRLAQSGTGSATAPRLNPHGWHDNWFADTSRRASRVSAAADWEHSVDGRTGAHVVLVGLRGEMQAMTGTVRHRTVRIEDAADRLVRQIDFGSSDPVTADSRQWQMVAGDRWDINRRWRVETGIRLDADRRAGNLWSPRMGVRYQADATGRTVVKAGAGRFVGRLPLSAFAFAAMGRRVDTSFEATTGAVLSVVEQVPVQEALRLPRADSWTLELEQRVADGLDLQIGVRQRDGSELPTVRLARGVRDVRLRSDGRSRYRELQVTMRRAWSDSGQLFVSYVRSAASGETNDFATLYHDFEVPHLEPSSWSRTAADVPNRWLMWGTFKLPLQLAISPALEMHTGFPYTGVDSSRRLVGAANDARFPPFFSADAVIYRAVSVRGRNFDLGAQIFNLTRHFNPRTVMPVVDAPLPERFLNSVGLRAAGYMVVKWQ